MMGKTSRFWLVGLLVAGLGVLGCDLGTDPLPDQACETSSDCPDGLYCLVNAGVCVQCLMDEHCEASGQCDEARHVCEEPEPECELAEECEVEAACQIPACVAGKCSSTAMANGTACDDQDPCTANDQCTGSLCVGAAIAGCGSEGCVGMKDGTECDDGDECTASDSCQEGQCIGLGVPGCGFQQDEDQDGYSLEDGDCNDTDPSMYPGAMEVCDGVDNNCDGMNDEGCPAPVCFASGCNMEICSTADVDSECTWLPQYDCLVHTTCGNFGENGECGWDQNLQYLDCLAQICTPSEEVCDGVDNDCNGLADEGCGAQCGGLSGIPCSPDEYCQYPVDMCFYEDMTGSCVVVPFACDQMYAPVCGCDGITYGNECAMASSMVSMWHEGPCEEEACKAVAYEDFGLCLAILGYAYNGEKCVLISGCECGQFCPWVFPTLDKCKEACGLVDPSDCESDDDCPEGSVCQVYCGNGWCSGVCQEATGNDDDGDGWTSWDGDCDDSNPAIYPYAVETCNQKDDDCDNLVDEQCGSQSCGGFTGVQCAEGAYCQFEFGTCGAADELGVCAPMPDACPANYAPVCGCDYETYGNECEAAGAGVSVLYGGPCPIYGQCKDLAGVDFGACAMVIGVAVVSGQCVGVSGCGCGNECDYFFQSMQDCVATCM